MNGSTCARCVRTARSNARTAVALSNDEHDGALWRIGNRRTDLIAEPSREAEARKLPLAGMVVKVEPASEV
jgi:hypothetical protein